MNPLSLQKREREEETEKRKVGRPKKKKSPETGEVGEVTLRRICDTGKRFDSANIVVIDSYSKSVGIGQDFCQIIKDPGIKILFGTFFVRVVTMYVRDGYVLVGEIREGRTVHEYITRCSDIIDGEIYFEMLSDDSGFVLRDKTGNVLPDSVNLHKSHDKVERHDLAMIIESFSKLPKDDRQSVLNELERQDLTATIMESFSKLSKDDRQSVLNKVNEMNK